MARRGVGEVRGPVGGLSLPTDRIDKGGGEAMLIVFYKGKAVEKCMDWSFV